MQTHTPRTLLIVLGIIILLVVVVILGRSQGPVVSDAQVEQQVEAYMPSDLPISGEVKQSYVTESEAAGVTFVITYESADSAGDILSQYVNYVEERRYQTTEQQNGGGVSILLANRDGAEFRMSAFEQQGNTFVEVAVTRTDLTSQQVLGI